MRGKDIPPQKTEDGKSILYHGTKKKFEKFKTPTGVERLDVMEGGVIYFTSDIETAKRYAGPDGYFCVVEIEDPIPYAEQRKKQGLPSKQKRFTRNVYIALPIDVEIKEFIRVSDLEGKGNRMI